MNCPDCEGIRLTYLHVIKKHNMNYVDFKKLHKLNRHCKNCGKEIEQKKTFCTAKCKIKFIYTEDYKKNLSLKRKKFLYENKNKHNWSIYRKKESKPEKLFKLILEKCKINDMIIQWYIPDTKRHFEIDFAIINKKIGFEINGNQHYDKNGNLFEYYQNRHNYLKMIGWKIIEIPYLLCFHENECFKIIKQALNNDTKLVEKKTIEIFDYRKMKINIKLFKQKKWQESLQNIRELESLKQKNRIEKIKNSKIDFSKFGWVEKTANLLNLSSQYINRWIKKYMKDFYVNNCFKKYVSVAQLDRATDFSNISAGILKNS